MIDLFINSLRICEIRFISAELWKFRSKIDLIILILFLPKNQSVLFYRVSLNNLVGRQWVMLEENLTNIQGVVKPVFIPSEYTFVYVVLQGKCFVSFISTFQVILLGSWVFLLWFYVMGSSAMVLNSEPS